MSRRPCASRYAIASAFSLNPRARAKAPERIRLLRVGQRNDLDHQSPPEARAQVVAQRHACGRHVPRSDELAPVRSQHVVQGEQPALRGAVGAIDVVDGHQPARVAESIGLELRRLRDEKRLASVSRARARRPPSAGASFQRRPCPRGPAPSRDRSWRATRASVSIASALRPATKFSNVAAGAPASVERQLLGHCTPYVVAIQRRVRVRRPQVSQARPATPRRAAARAARRRTRTAGRTPAARKSPRPGASRCDRRRDTGSGRSSRAAGLHRRRRGPRGRTAARSTAATRRPSRAPDQARSRRRE